MYILIKHVICIFLSVYEIFFIYSNLNSEIIVYDILSYSYNIISYFIIEIAYNEYILIIIF